MFMYGMPISNILHCAKIHTKPNASLANYGRHAHAIVYFLEGNSDYNYGGKIYYAKAGSILFLPKGESYVINRLSYSKCIYIDFLTVDDVKLTPFVKNYPNTAHYRDIFTSILSSYRQKRIGYECELMGLLYKLISMIQVSDRTEYLPDSKYTMIASAVDYIDRNYKNSDIKISFLASVCKISTRYFCELFSAFFGVSPKEYIIRKRIESAKNMLISSDDKISDIAENCGFSDVYYFSKVFKKEFNETPSAFRSQNKIL